MASKDSIMEDCTQLLAAITVNGIFTNLSRMVHGPRLGDAFGMVAVNTGNFRDAVYDRLIEDDHVAVCGSILPILGGCLHSTLALPFTVHIQIHKNKFAQSVK